MRILSLEFQPEHNFFINVDIWLIRPTLVRIKIFVREECGSSSYGCDCITPPDYAKLKSAILFALDKEKVSENLDPRVRKAIQYITKFLKG